MKEKPILFSTPMVQAILAGNKTMTRRVVKPQPDHRHRAIVFEYGKLNEYSQISGVWHVQKQHKCPHGQPGDRLWVRETWQYTANGTYYYKATDKPEHCPWRPSIHMPKGAARIWLEVTNVRVERLQEITEEGAINEGVAFFNPCETDVGQNAFDALAARAKFISLWDSLNAKRGYGWDTNPWVWVISFERTRP